jgi:hypothetical protein
MVSIARHELAVAHAMVKRAGLSPHQVPGVEGTHLKEHVNDVP